jgi:hypothetical protein
MMVIAIKILIVLVGIWFLIIAISYIILKVKIERKYIEVVVLKRFKYMDYFNFLLSIFYIGIGFGYKSLLGYEGKYHSLFYLFIGMLGIVLSILRSGEFVYLTNKGIKYKVLIKWESIKSIRKHPRCPTDLIIYTEKHSTQIDFYTEERIVYLKSLIQKISPDSLKFFNTI